MQEMRLTHVFLRCRGLWEPLGGFYTGRVRYAALIVLLALTPAVRAAEEGFADVVRGDERAAVDDLRAQGRVQGYADGTFRPRTPINRAEFLKMLLHERAEDAVGEPCFSDVPPAAWFAPSVCRAKARGVVVGYPDGTFGPEKTVTVAEALSMIVRGMHLPVNAAVSEPWTLRFEEAGQRAGILDRSAYRPHDPLTRGLAALLVSRALLIRDGAFQDAQREHLSAGCGVPAPTTPPASVRVNDQRRPFLLAVPSSYTPRTPHALIVAFHGRTNSNEQVRDYMGLERDHAGFIIVYPQGERRDDGTFTWSDATDGAKALRDYALFDAVTEEVAQHYCIDRDAVFVVGHSLGAWFASTLACARGDVIRGSAVVAGGISATACSGPAAALLIHHTEDALVPFSEGERNRAKKIEQNLCSNEEKTVMIGGFSCLEQQDCRTGNPVTFCPSSLGHGFDGIGHNTHTWPRPAGGAVLEYFRTLLGS